MIAGQRSMALAEPPSLRLAVVWEDEWLVELSLRVCDGTSCFVNRCYSTHAELEEVGGALAALAAEDGERDLDVRFAERPDAAYRSFHGEFRFRLPGRVFVVTHQVGDKRWVADDVPAEARLYLQFEPWELDAFARALLALARRERDEALLGGDRR